MEIFRTDDLIGHKVFHIPSQRPVERQHENANWLGVTKARFAGEASGAKLPNPHKRRRGLTAAGGPSN